MYEYTPPPPPPPPISVLASALYALTFFMYNNYFAKTTRPNSKTGGPVNITAGKTNRSIAIQSV